MKIFPVYLTGKESEKIILKENSKSMSYIYNGSLNLHKYIISLGSLAPTYLCKEIDFQFKASIKRKDGNGSHSVHNIKGTLEFLEGENIEQYFLILQTDSRQLLSEIMQQLIFLDCNLEVMLEKEEVERRVSKALDKHYMTVLSSVEKAKKRIIEVNVDDINKSESERLSNDLDEMHSLLLELKKKRLSIAVMATRKAGKSVIVNCFLQDEYAPTSIELPTPSSLVYTESENNQIKITSRNGKGIDKTFKTSNDAKEFLFKLFTDAEDNQKYVSDLDVSYICKNQQLANYQIIDTPGPDYSGAQDLKHGDEDNIHDQEIKSHADIAIKWISQADVILFLVDYAKAMTSGEENFLRSIKKAFEIENKFYSLIVVANKMDVMYESEEYKHKTRYLDYLRGKLTQMGYKEFFVLGTSALSYHYCEKVKLLPEWDHKIDFETNIKKCRIVYAGTQESEMTALSFIRGMIGKLEDFHGVFDVNEDVLKQYSGIPSLVKFSNFIAEEKANVEIKNNIMFKFDRKLSDLKNRFLILSLEKHTKEKHIIEEVIKELISEVEKSKLEVMRADFFATLKHDITNTIDSNFKTLQDIAFEQIESEVDGFFMGIIKRGNSEVKDMYKGGCATVYHPNFPLLLQEEIISGIGSIKILIDKNLVKKEKTIRQANENLVKKIEKNQDKLREKHSIDISIDFPILQFSFNLEKISKGVEMGQIEVSPQIRESIDQKSGFWGTVSNIVTFGISDWSTGDYYMNNEKLAKQIEELKTNTKNKISRQITELKRQLKPDIEETTNKVFEGYQYEINELTEHYVKLFEKIHSDLNLSKQEMHSKISFLKEVSEAMDDVINVWQPIRLARG